MLGALPSAVGLIDVAIVVAYVATASLVGIFAGRGQTDNRAYFLGDHRLPAWALLLSIVATETSTVTFLSVPGLSYMEGGNLTFLQIALGYVVGRLAIVAWLLPSYFRGEMLTAYEVLGQRFGASTRRLASLLFLVTRNLADGLRLFLTALVVHIAFGFDFLTCVLIMSAATTVYSVCGGVRSVVWNDCLQFGVYLLGAIAASYVLVTKMPSGWSQIFDFGRDTGRFQLFDFDTSLTKSTITFWSGLIGGAFLTLATHGADHMMVQRYLCARSRKSAGWALALSGPVVFVQFAFFLLIGVQLACFYANFNTPHTIGSNDEALISFVVHEMGTGLRGLILAAVFAASMSSSLNSLSSSMMDDLILPVLPPISDRQSLLLARLLTVGFGVIQAAVAIAAHEFSLQRSVIDSVLAIAGFSTGLILGLYGLGLLVKRTSERTALIAFTIGTIVTCYAVFGTDLAWQWYTLVGSGTIVIVGLALSLIFDRREQIAQSS